MNGKADHRVYELTEPGDDLPRYITWGNGTWLDRRWALRHVDGSLLAAWFRELEARGLYPGISTRWVPADPCSRYKAGQLARARVQQVCEWVGHWPTWLLGDRLTGGAPSPPLPVMYTLEGTAYPSITEAARARQVSAEFISYALRTSLPDREGGFWVETGNNAVNVAGI